MRRCILRAACFRSEGPTVSSHVRKGVVEYFKDNERRRCGIKSLLQRN